MLWTDNDFISPDELLTLDSEVGDVAAAESISLAGSNGVIHRAIEEAGDTLMKHSRQFGGGVYNGSVSPGHNAAVMNVGLPATNRAKLLLTQVVVTGLMPGNWTPLKRWAAYWALYVFYRDASNRTNNDRYKGKAGSYQKDLHKTHWESVRSFGIPTVAKPLPAPGALYELNTGTWDDTNLTLTAGAGTTTDTATVVVTWVDSTQSSNNESNPSAVATIALTAGNVLRVNISSLVAPNGKQPTATVPLATIGYGTGTGWNIYVARNAGPMVLQNVTPIPAATLTYTLPGDPLVTGLRVGTGQYAELYQHFNNTVDRG